MGLRVSPVTGVNPSVSVCFFCQKDKNELVLAGLMRGDVEAPRRAVWSMEPCNRCKSAMQQGVILISIDEIKSVVDQDYWRSGGWLVVKEDLIRRLGQDPEFGKHAFLDPSVVGDILKNEWRSLMTACGI